jgi:hypothetical protein
MTIIELVAEDARACATVLAYPDRDHRAWCGTDEKSGNFDGSRSVVSAGVRRT